MTIDMKALARRGAHTRLAELVAEMDSLLEAFPDLGTRSARPTASKGRKLSEETKAKMRASWARRKAAAGDTQTDSLSAAVRPKKRRTMSAEARERISVAQKRRWKVKKAGKKR